MGQQLDTITVWGMKWHAMLANLFIFLSIFFLWVTLSAPRSFLDMIKVMLFSYLFWCVLIVIFFAGTMRISLFCLGYLVGCFYFLLFGGQLLLQPVRRTIRLWDYIIAYNVMVIFMKNVLSVGPRTASPHHSFTVTTTKHPSSQFIYGTVRHNTPTPNSYDDCNRYSLHFKWLCCITQTGNTPK